MTNTYTDNLHLELQEDKTDYLDWDAITENWKKIDSAYGSNQETNNNSNSA